MSNVFVIDTHKQALNPVHPARARLLLKVGKAAVFRRYPFTIILKRKVSHPCVAPLRLKLDPGSRTTGLVLVNATRWALYEQLQATGLPVEVGTGGLTKYNRAMRGLAKTHWLDAACVGASTPEHLQVSRVQPLLIRATGHGSRQMCRMNKYGFPRTKPKQRHKSYLGFRTGDLVKALIPDGVNQGSHQGRIVIRFRPAFILNGFDVHPHHVTLLHRNDGYNYAKGVSHSSLSLKA